MMTILLGILMFITGFFISLEMDSNFMCWFARLGLCGCSLILIGLGIYEVVFPGVIV